MFVLSLAIVPPLVLVIRTVVNPRYLKDSSKAVLLLYLVLYVLVIRGIVIPFFINPLRRLPQPPGGSAILGHVRAELKQPRGSIYGKWIDTVPNSGLIFFRGLFQASSHLLLTTPEALQEVLVAHPYDFEKPAPGRLLLSRTIGSGLITVEGNEHKHQRKNVTPAFSGKHIKELVPLFWTKSQDFVNAIADQLDVSHSESDKEGRSGVVEINQWASRVTLDIIGLACVGRDFNSLYNSDDEFVQHYDKILKTDKGNIIVFVLLSILLPLRIARWTPFYTGFREASEGRYQLRPLCRRLIDIKRRDMATESEKHIDILSVLMRPGNLSDDELVNQLLTFLAAGYVVPTRISERYLLTNVSATRLPRALLRGPHGYLRLILPFKKDCAPSYGHILRSMDRAWMLPRSKCSPTSTGLPTSSFASSQPSPAQAATSFVIQLSSANPYPRAQ